MKIIKYLVLVMCLCTALNTIAKPVTDKVKIFTNVNLLDVEKGNILERHVLILNDDLIVHIGQSIPAQYNGIDALDMQGQYVIPGLIDTHAHITLGEVSLKKRDDAYQMHANNDDQISVWNARELMRWGVTYIRNPGGSRRHNLDYKQQVEQGKLVGPKAKVAGEIISKIAFSGLTIAINKNQTMRAAIERQKAAGVDIIKLYAGLSEQEIQEAIKIAHELDMTVIGHLEDVSWTDAANWGIDGLVHAMPVSPKLLSNNVKQEFEKTRRPGAFTHFEWYEKVDLDSTAMQQLYTSLSDNHVYVDPTLIVFKNSFYNNSKEVIEHPDLTNVHPELLNNWQTFFNFNIGWQAEDFARAQKVWPKVLGFVNRLYKEGVPLTVGSDLGNPWVIPGLSVHQEMQLFAEAGIPNHAILKMATLQAAEQLDIADNQGSIAEGKLANLVFLE